jgi:hypothetical protein
MHEQIAGDQHAVAVDGDEDGLVTRGVPGGGDDVDAGREVHVAGDHIELIDLLQGFQQRRHQGGAELPQGLDIGAL